MQSAVFWVLLRRGLIVNFVQNFPSKPSYRAVYINKTIMSLVLYQSSLKSRLHAKGVIRALCCAFITIVTHLFKQTSLAQAGRINAARTVLVALLLPLPVTPPLPAAESILEAV